MLAGQSMDVLGAYVMPTHETCSRRSTLLQTLLGFIRSSERELDWLREREAIEVNRDWSASRTWRSDELQSYLKEAVEELKQREAHHNDLCVLGSTMQLDNHPAANLVQSYLTALERHWSWLFQLIDCSGYRTNQLIRRDVLLRDAAECETFLRTQLGILRSEFGSPHHPVTLKEAEKLKSRLKCILDQVNDREPHIVKLKDEASEMVPLSVNGDPDHLGLPVRALCCFRSADYWTGQPGSHSTLVSAVGEVFWPTGDEPGGFDKGDSLVLISHLNPKIWSLRTPSGSCMNIPSVCFIPSWACEHITGRIRQVGSLLTDMKSNLFLVNLRLESQLLAASLMSCQSRLSSAGHSALSKDGLEATQRLATDGLRHLLAMRLANQPVNEIEQFESQLHSFEVALTKAGPSARYANSEAEQMDSRTVDQLRQSLNLLALRLQESATHPLPHRASDLTQRIHEHRVSAFSLRTVASRRFCFPFAWKVDFLALLPH
ncbi:unnamed protein product [Dicrocoelium dendriticum]|nr:unnamed protein product [Dicrocoelium dendriticum]